MESAWRTRTRMVEHRIDPLRQLLPLQTACSNAAVQCAKRSDTFSTARSIAEPSLQTDAARPQSQQHSTVCVRARMCTCVRAGACACVRARVREHVRACVCARRVHAWVGVFARAHAHYCMRPCVRKRPRVGRPRHTCEMPRAASDVFSSARSDPGRCAGKSRVGRFGVHVAPPAPPSPNKWKNESRATTCGRQEQQTMSNER